MSKIVKIKITAQEIKHDGKKFTAYKGQKGAKLIDLTFTRAVPTALVPRLEDCPCYIYVPVDGQNIQTHNRVYPRWWVKEVLKIEPIEVKRTYTDEDLEGLEVIDHTDDLPL